MAELVDQSVPNEQTTSVYSTQHIMTIKKYDTKDFYNVLKE